MKKSNNSVLLRYVITYCLVLAVFSTYTLTVSASPENKSPKGELIIYAQFGGQPSATVNGESADSGRTFFSSNMVTTSENTFATIKLGKLGYVNLTPNSKLTLMFSDNTISGILSAGQIKVFNNENVSVNIKTPDNVINNQAQQKGIFTVDVQTGVTKAFTDAGTIYMNNGTTAVPAQTAQDDNASRSSLLGPLIVYGAIVAAVVVYVTVHNGSNNGAFVTPIR